jgi:hypothetical protein
MKQVIEDILNNTILPEYEDLICGFEIKEPHERFDAKGDTPFKFISVTVTFIAGYGTKYWPITLSVRDKFDDIMNDIWDVIYNYTNIATDVYHKTVSKCEGKVIHIKESKEKSSKLNLAKKLIYELFSEVSFIKIGEYHGKPLIKVYFDSDDTAANIESFFTHEICDTLKDYTGGEIICNPGWGPEWRTNRNNPDILIDAILLKYDDEGNVINESETDIRSTQKMDFEAINFYNNKVTKSTDVITVAKSWNGGGYNWGEGSGLSIPLMWVNPKTGKEEILKDKQEKGTYCSGYVLQVGYIVAKNRNLFNNKTKDEVINLINQWYGPDKKTCVTAITNANIGKEIKFEQAQPGDFCQLWRTNGSGHNVIFLNFIKNKNNDIIGIKYRSTQTKTNGIGDNIEYFKGFGGKVNKNDTYFARLNNSVGGENKKPNIDYPKTKLQPLLSSKLGESVENNTTVVEKNINAINTLLSLVSWEGLCDIWVEYNPEDEDYEIRSKTTVRHLYSDEILKELESLENSLRSMGIKVYTYTPWYVENCEDEVEFMNESENKKSNYVNVIKELVEPFKNEDCVCEINVSYDDEDDMYSVYFVLGNNCLNDKFLFVPAMTQYTSKLRNQIKNTIKSYLPIDNIYVGSYGKPNCEWNPTISEAHKVDKDEYIELYRDKDFILTIPLTHEASKKYGSDTKWCTTKKDCNKDFKKHTELGVLGYIVVRDKELKERLGSNAFAIYRLKGDDITRTIAFDDQNNEYRNGESWLGNKFDRVDKLFQFYKMMNKYNDYFEKQDLEETIEESKEISKKELSEDIKYNKVNVVLNRVMGSKYEWWKGIEINDIVLTKNFKIALIKAVLKVDEEWGEEQWGEYNMHMAFPKNDGWEDNETYELVTLGDIIGGDLADDLSEEILDVLTFTGVSDPKVSSPRMSFRSIMLKFE